MKTASLPLLALLKKHSLGVDCVTLWVPTLTKLRITVIINNNNIIIIILSRFVLVMIEI